MLQCKKRRERIMKTNKALQIAVLLLISTIVLSNFSAYADVEPKPFETNFTAAVNLNAKNWFATEENRSVLTCSLALDYTLATSDMYNAFKIGLFNNPSYVGRSGLLLVVIYPSSDTNQTLALFYDTTSHEGSYYVYDGMSSSLAERAIQAVATDGYYKNDVSTLYDVYTEMLKAFNQ